jgi:signal transduction histidine kinase
MSRAKTSRCKQLQHLRGAAGVCLLAAFLGGASCLRAEILWSDADARVVHHTDNGYDILGGVVKRNGAANDTLYFKFHVDPLSDVGTEEYFAAFQLFEGDEYRLAVGNSEEAWGYSAFYTSELGPSNKVAGDFNLQSSHPEASGLGVFQPYELVRHNQERTIVFRVQYIPGGDDQVTVWLSPDLERGATEKNQSESLTTKFKADASFDQIRLRHGGNGNGWIFSGMAVATSFNDFVVERFWQTLWFNGLMVLVLLAGVGATVRLVEKKKFQRQLQLAEQESALDRERARIAQDLHDDLGSTLTRISLVSGLLRADKHNPEHVEAHASKLAQSADQVVRSLEEIVWAVRPGSDTLQSLLEYITHFAQESFDGDTARCRLDLPDNLPGRHLPPEMRHNIFLIVKEALTNALKHAGAREVRVCAKATPTTLEMAVEDDGRGFDLPAVTAHGRRNGLGNMQRRAGAIGARLTVQSAAGSGTRVHLEVPFPGQGKAAGSAPAPCATS